MITGVRILRLLLLVQMLAFSGDRKATSADVVRTVFTSLYSDHDDARLAQSLGEFQLDEQLSPHVLRYFRTVNLGPKSSAVLEKLVVRSASMPTPELMPFSIQPLPSPDTEYQMLHKVVQYARTYVERLPNFLCDEITERYTNLKGFDTNGNPQYGRTLHHSDRFTRSLRFTGGREQAETIQVKGPSATGKPSDDVVTKKGHSISTGEFGGDMAFIFGPGIDAEMHWDHWESNRQGRSAVFNYFVGVPKTRFTLYFCCALQPGFGEVEQTCRAPIKGLVYLEAETGVISRLVIQAVNLPDTFHVKENNTIIDYDDVLIAGKKYRLPIHALVFVRTDSQINRNQIDFIKYRKFEAESVFTYTDSRITSLGNPKF